MVGELLRYVHYRAKFRLNICHLIQAASKLVFKATVSKSK